MEQRFPFKICDCCNKTRTSWVVNYSKDGYPMWRRTCPYCMTPEEHAQMLMMIHGHVRKRVIYKYGSQHRTA